MNSEKKLDWPCVGIDLGTTNCRIAIMKGEKVVIIENEFGLKKTPSIVGFSDEMIVGEQAKSYAVMKHENTIYDKEIYWKRIQ